MGQGFKGLTVPPDVSDIECRKVNGELVPILKCRYCNFRNIHEETIRHHMLWNNQAPHKRVDTDKIDKNEFYVRKNRKKSRYHYKAKEDYGLPWIKCFWCSYEDNVIRDLEWHFLENHRYQLYKLDVDAECERSARREWISLDSFYWMYSDIDYVLYRAARLAKQKRGII